MFSIEAAPKRPSQVSTLPEPKLTLVNLGVGHPFSSLIVSDFAYRAIGVSQEIPFPSKLGLAAEEAKREADSESQNYRSMVLEKTLQLKTAYYDWYFVTKAIEITSKNRDLLDRFEQIATAGYAVGKGLQPDVLKAQVEVSGLAQQLELLEQKKLLAGISPEAFVSTSRVTRSEATKDGVPVQQVRKDIEARYQPKYGAGSPTPQPPSNLKEQICA